MSRRTLQYRKPWLAYGMAISCAFAVSLLYWQARTDWRGWRQITEGHVLLAKSGSGTLSWKEPVLPAQYAQASCGACHRDELPQTPRLNHGRQLMVRFNCTACHQLQDIERPAMLGPDLTNIGTKVTREWIYKWLNEPRSVSDANGNVVVDGVDTEEEPRMPKFRLTETELRGLSAYLSVQKAKAFVPYKLDARVVAAWSKNPDLTSQGELRFRQMFCSTCHTLAVTRAG